MNVNVSVYRVQCAAGVPCGLLVLAVLCVMAFPMCGVCEFCSPCDVLWEADFVIYRKINTLSLFILQLLDGLRLLMELKLFHTLSLFILKLLERPNKLICFLPFHNN